jgi:hypothetical protein
MTDMEPVQATLSCRLVTRSASWHDERQTRMPLGTEMNAAEQIEEGQVIPPAAVSQMVNHLFDHWRLNGSDRAALLYHSEQQQTVDEAVASNESAERIGHLLAIHAHLRTLFPQNPELAYAWMSTGNKSFDGLTPVAVVRDQGLEGLRAVRGYLEHSIGA